MSDEEQFESRKKDLKKKLNTEIKQLIEMYDQFTVEHIETKYFVNTKGRNNYEGLNDYKSKVGVYIFTDENYEPIYIGLAGDKKESEQSLNGRLQHHFRGKTNGSSFIKQIKEDAIEGANLKEELKKIAPYVMIIETGSIDKESNLKAQVLEKLLISAYPDTKYNK